MKKLLAVLLLLVSSYANAEVWKINMTFSSYWPSTTNVSGQFTTQGNSIKTWAFLPYDLLADDPSIRCYGEGDCVKPHATATFLSPEHILFSSIAGTPSSSITLDLWFDAPLTQSASLIDADLRVYYGQDSIGPLAGGTITAVPEPSSWLILLVAMLFLVYRLRANTLTKSSGIPKCNPASWCTKPSGYS